MDAKVISSAAELIGDAARARMLIALFDAEALPAGELARQANVSPQTASSHLGKLCSGGLLRVERSGRHRLYRLANAGVARAVESLMAIAPPSSAPQPSVPQSSRSSGTLELKPLHFARTCYDHLAGKLGVAVTEACLNNGWLTLTGGYTGEYVVTSRGEKAFSDLSIATDSLREKRRAFAKPCLDWTERRYHLAGALGAALTDTFFERGWLLRDSGSRVVYLTNRGRRELATTLALRI